VDCGTTRVFDADLTISFHGTDKWYTVTRPAGCPSLMKIQVSSTSGTVTSKFDLYQNQPVNPSLANGVTVTEVGAGSYFIDVYGGSTFELLIS
jgi:hypothetical protein